MRRISTFSIGLAVILSVAGPAWSQQTVTIPAEYDKLLRSRTAVTSLGPNLFGDEVNLYDGSLQFRQSDISLPGNNSLAIGVSRQFKVRQQEGVEGLFADWELEIPRLHGVFSTSGWIVPIPSGQPSSAAQMRCSRYGAPPGAAGIGGGSFSATEFWAGSFLALPGSGGGELLKRATNTPVPNDGQNYPLTTRDGVVLRCLSALAPTSSGTGEGFEALAPDGTRYRFDQMAVRLAPSLFKAEPYPEMAAKSSKNQAGTVSALVPDGYMMNRREVWIMPTVVTDRFGNTLTYAWATDDPWKLMSMTASDGRTLSFTYVPGSRRIASISNGTHSWNYGYQSTAAGWRMSQVTLPDNSKWTFQLEPLRNVMASVDGAGCNDVGTGYINEATGLITHPSGAQGSFSVAGTVHGRSHVWLDCRSYGYDQVGYAYHPDKFLVASLAKKPCQALAYCRRPGITVTGLRTTATPPVLSGRR